MLGAPAKRRMIKLQPAAAAAKEGNNLAAASTGDLDAHGRPRLAKAGEVEMCVPLSRLPGARLVRARYAPKTAQARTRIPRQTHPQMVLS